MANDLILVVGAADTGRAPMTAAMLRRRLAERGYAATVESAGILGHDGDPPTAEAVATVEQMELDIASYRARTLSDELAGRAALLIAIDSGVARVARSRFPQAADRIETLGALAGSPRDIPDPFKMQIGAWLTYAREIDQLIEQALPRILAALPDLPPAPTPAVAPPQPLAPQLPRERAEAHERIIRLVQLAAQMPGVVDWSAARAQIEADLTTIAALPARPDDLAGAYTGLLRAALALTPAPPAPGKLAALQEALERLAAPVDHEALAAFSTRLGGWATL